MRALLIVNPHATSTTEMGRDVIVHALASELDLEVVQTRYRGHALSVAAAAARDGHGAVLAFGGDGTVNEVVNGLMRASPPQSGRTAAAAPRSAAGQAAARTVARPGAPPMAAHTAAPLGTQAAAAWPARQATPSPDGHPAGAPPASQPPLPLLGLLPGGNANVFTLSLGVPADPADAAGRLLAAIKAGRTRTVGLGLAGDRYFCFNAGLGLDAEVVRVVEGLRARGRTASAALYVRTAIRQFASVTDRRNPALVLERDGEPDIDGLFLALISNTSIWTYWGRREVRASPAAGFDTGLDLMGLRRLGTFGTLRVLRQMLGRRGVTAGKHVVSLHDQSVLSLRAVRPVAFQVDGEYVGEREHVSLESIPDALRILA